MKVLLNTNVLVSAFASHGACADLFEHCLRNHEILAAAFSLGEMEKVLAGKFRMDLPQVRKVLDFLSANATVVALQGLEAPVCRDPDDDHILGAALSAGADCIVTGDEDLLVLKEYKDIPIINPAAFWRIERRTRRR